MTPARMFRAPPVPVVLMLVAAGAAACHPPETLRARGGDSGADIGNRSPVVEMHAGSEIYPDWRCGVVGADCTGPLPLSGREGELDRPARDAPPLIPDPYVIEHMGRGGQLRRVVYEPPPDLARPDPPEIEPAQPGPETGAGEVVEGDTPPDPAEDPGRAEEPVGPPDGPES